MYGVRRSLSVSILYKAIILNEWVQWLMAHRRFSGTSLGWDMILCLDIPFGVAQKSKALFLDGLWN